MEKRLCKAGNGLALYIDKGLQRLLGFQDGSIVTVETDGIRLLVSPSGASTEPAKKLKLEPWNDPYFRGGIGAESEDDVKVAYFAKDTYLRLSALGFTNEHFLQVEQIGWTRLIRKRSPGALWSIYGTTICQGRGIPLQERAEFSTMRRLQHCLRYREEGDDWGTAIERALAAVPMEFDPYGQGQAS